MKMLSNPTAFIVAAAHERGLILSHRSMAAFEAVEAKDLAEKLLELGNHQDECRGNGALEVFGDDTKGGLGHAETWIGAGEVYEAALAASAASGPVRTVFCVDPWAAQLKSRAGELAPEAEWVFVSDLARRGAGAFPDYWEQLDSWIRNLNFHAIVSREEWESALRDTLRENTSGRVHDQVFGAWQWRRVLPRSGTTILFLVRYSGSLLHLKAFLQSLVRQDDSEAVVHCTIVGKNDADRPDALLGCFRRAHPGIIFTQISPLDDRSLEQEVRRLLAESPGATLVLIGDHSILPAGFLREARSGGLREALPASLGVEPSAHILSGNLDPVANYETLLRTTPGANPAEPRGIARIIPAEFWKESSAATVTSPSDLFSAEPFPKTSSPLSLLQVADIS